MTSLGNLIKHLKKKKINSHKLSQKKFLINSPKKRQDEGMLANLSNKATNTGSHQKQRE